MQVWHSSSSESKPCVMCGKKTSHYKVYEQSSMTISIPLCDYGHVDGYETRDCYAKVDVKAFATGFLKEVKRLVKNS